MQVQILDFFYLWQIRLSKISSNIILVLKNHTSLCTQNYYYTLLSTIDLIDCTNAIIISCFKVIIDFNLNVSFKYARVFLIHRLRIWFVKGKNYKDIPIHETARQLGANVCMAIVFFHALSLQNEWHGKEERGKIIL